MNLTIAVAIVAFIVGAALAAIIYRGDIAELKLEHAKTERQAAIRLAEKQAEYRDQERRYIVQANEASRQHTEEIKNAKTAAATARTELDRLRGVLARSAGMPGTSSDSAGTGAIDTAAAADVLGECGGELQALAEKADGHVADLRQYKRAWPE